MRLKIFTGVSVSAAMAKVRDELGDDAIIINVDEAAPGGVRISAAYEPPEPDFAQAALVNENIEVADPEAVAGLHLEHSSQQVPFAPPPNRDDAGPRTSGLPFDPDLLQTVLRHHGLPSPLTQRLMKLSDDPVYLDAALARGLEQTIDFSGLAANPARPIMLVGPPGAGKTLTAAKIAAMSRIRGGDPQVISTDLLRSAGVAQLEMLCEKLGVMVATAGQAPELRHLLSRHTQGAVRIVDTTGVNAYSMEDAERIARLAAQSKAEPILVLPAGIDALEAAEQAHVFATLGVKRMIITRVDGARRLSGLLTALVKGKLKLAGICASPFLADGIIDGTPLNLARYLIEKPDPARLGISPRLGASPQTQTTNAPHKDMTQ